MTAVIYALVDPFTQAIRYIGRTQQPLRARLWGHLNQRSNPSKQQWLIGLCGRGTEPEIIVLDEIDNPAEAPAIEGEWINWGIAHGLALLNKEIPRARTHSLTAGFLAHDQGDAMLIEAVHRVSALYASGRLDWSFDAPMEETPV